MDRVILPSGHMVVMSPAKLLLGLRSSPRKYEKIVGDTVSFTYQAIMDRGLSTHDITVIHLTEQ